MPRLKRDEGVIGPGDEEPGVDPVSLLDVGVDLGLQFRGVPRGKILGIEARPGKEFEGRLVLSGWPFSPWFFCFFTFRLDK